jgi:hypothetical protein
MVSSLFRLRHTLRTTDTNNEGQEAEANNESQYANKMFAFSRALDFHTELGLSLGNLATRNSVASTVNTYR